MCPQHGMKHKTAINNNTYYCMYSDSCHVLYSELWAYQQIWPISSNLSLGRLENYS